MNIQNIKLSHIKPYQSNAKKHDKKQITQVANSIKRFGWAQPLVIDKDNNLIIGHARLEAAKQLGLTDVPVLMMENLTEKEVIALRLADNKLNESAWDMKLVIPELKMLDLETLELTGFDKDLIIEPDEADDVIPENVPARSKLGDLYELGQHRVLCGDSTQPEAVSRLMDGKKADMVFTDPPYRMEAEGGRNQWVGKSAAKIGENIKDIISFEPEEWLGTLPLYFEKGMNAYIFCNKDLVPDYLNWARKCKYAFNILFWKKPNALPLGEQHRPDVEYLITIRKNAVWNNAVQGVSYSKSLEFGRENSTPHPTMKPVELIVNELKISSNSEGIVIDDFLGSGSTLIACEKTGRICYGMELDPKYADVIVQRYVDYVDSPIVKLNGKIIEWNKSSKA